MRQHRLALCGSDFLEWLPEQTERFITKNAFKAGNPNMAKLLTALGSQDKNHLSDLLAFAHKRGVPTDAS